MRTRKIKTSFSESLKNHNPCYDSYHRNPYVPKFCMILQFLTVSGSIYIKINGTVGCPPQNVAIQSHFLFRICCSTKSKAMHLFDIYDTDSGWQPFGRYISNWLCIIHTCWLPCNLHFARKSTRNVKLESWGDLS